MFFIFRQPVLAVINGICSCNDHLIEVKESNFGAAFFLILNKATIFLFLCLMLDSLVKYERDKRNFVRHNYNGLKLFIVSELVTFLMVTTILRGGRYRCTAYCNKY